MSKASKVAVKKAAKASRSRKPGAKPLAVVQSRRSSPATPREKRHPAPIVELTTTAPPKAAVHIVDLMLAWSPLNVMLQQQAAFASMLSGFNLDKRSDRQQPPARETNGKPSRKT